jgi:integrase
MLFAKNTILIYIKVIIPYMAKIAEFLEQYPSRGTKHSYSTGINAFLSFINQYTRTGGQRITPEDRMRFEVFAEHYINDGRDYEQDLIDFSRYCDQHYAPTSGRLYINIVKEFLSHYDIEFTRKQQKRILNKAPDGGPVSEEADLSKDMLQKLLNVCDIRMKALVLVLLTSGMRIGEVVTIHDKDIEIAPNQSYGIVSLRGVSRKREAKLKNRHSRTTFIGKEAVKALLQWYEVRAGYIERSCKRSRDRWKPSDLNDGRIFPFGIPSLGESLRTALKNSNLFTKDDETGRSLVHFHLFRKYFITTMTNSGIPEKFVDFYAGHLGELDRAYQKQTKEKLLEVYMRGEPYLRVYDDGAEEIAKTKEEIREATEAMRDLRIDNLEMKSKLQDFDRMQQRMKDMEQKMMALEVLTKMQEKTSPDAQAIINSRVDERLKKSAARSK